MNTISPRLRLADLIARAVRANELRNRGVCVMPIVQTVPASPPVTQDDLPLRQRRALLVMRFNSDLARKVNAAIQELPDCVSKLVPADFHPLLQAGLCTRQGDYHRLTDRGVRTADRVVEAFARQLGMHELIVSHYGRQLHFTARCTCGETFTAGASHREAAISASFTRHLRDVETARVAGVPYVPGPERTRKLIEAWYPEIPSPKLQPE